MDQEQIQEEFKKRRMRQRLLLLPIAGMVGLLLWTKANPAATTIMGLPVNMVIGVTVAFVVGAVVFSLVNWRCPACNSYLGKGLSPNFCPKCGADLQGNG